MKIRHTILCLASAFLLFAGCKEEKPAAGTVEITGPAGMTVSVGGKKFQKEVLRLRMSPGTYGFVFEAPGYYSRVQCLEIRRDELLKLSVEMEKVLSSVLIDSVPSGAEVRFGGRVLGAAPLVISDLPAGKHHAELVKPGYSRKLVSWEIRSGRPHPRLLAELDLSAGSLIITTTPAGARVFLNGKDSGVTPRRISMDSGVYRMRIEHPGCEPSEEDVTIIRGRTLTRNIRLEARPGGVNITSEPAGALVFMDGKRLGKTPFAGKEITPGKHLIRLTAPGFDALEKSVSIAPGTVDQLHLRLVKSTGSAQFVIQPAGVQCFVDGRDLGRIRKDASGRTLPLKVSDLSPGKHVLTITHPRANPIKKEIAFTVEKGRQFNMPDPVELWIANCEIEFRNGKKEKGAVFGENENEIYYSPQPGVKYYLSRTNIRKLTMIPIE